MSNQHHGSDKTITDLYQTCHHGEVASVEGRFCRLFPSHKLPPNPAPRHQLLALGHSSGSMNEGTAGGAVGDSDVPAGFTFVGQLIDHDITLDTISRLDQFSDPGSIENGRTPNLDLDCVYGRGPEATPFMYKNGKLIIDRRIDRHLGGRFDDLPRHYRNKTAIIGDPRNDENLFVSQLQLGFLKFHNAMMDEVGEFEVARENVIHYYHRMIIEDFLPRIIEPNLLSVLCNNGRAYYLHSEHHRRRGRPCMPVEFSVAAYRYGHSQVRQTYHVNDAFQNVNFFDPGGFQQPETRVDWKYLFEVDTTHDPLMTRKIDTKLPEDLMDLPSFIASNPSSLAARNLSRGRTFRLPSGQAIARLMVEDGLVADTDVLPVHADVTAKGIKETPLWYYVLQEAQELGSGNKLGPVGGRIVGEVIVGLIEEYRDRTGKGLDLVPEVEVPQVDGDRFQIVDLLKFAGVA